MTLLRDERWPVAGLIPITSSTDVAERNAASVLDRADAEAESGRT